ncbi:MAG: M20/M25/M40 family metallo-hydrolase, partial [Bacteroidales bacterium]|nr:M20/M25/M40 family metallo-hydrolase [Bacteroidales bacterium]
QTDPKQKGLDAITMDAIKGQLEFLASDWTEGRATGERGEYMAGDYVASMFKVFGIAPGGDPMGFGGGRQRPGASGSQTAAPASQRTYFQNFSLIETVSTGPSSFTVRKGTREMTFDENVDFSGLRASMTTKFKAPVVFVGYGINDKSLGINEFAGLDVKGKIILRLTGYPGSGDPESAMYKKINASKTVVEIARMKTEALNGLDVAGVIDVTPGVDLAKRWGILKDGINMSPAESGGGRTNYLPMRLDGNEVQVGTVNITVTERVANFILLGSGIDMTRYAAEASSGTFRAKPILLTGVSAAISTEVETRRVRVRNVVAMIEGKNPNEFVVVGAHMDHMGMEGGRVWNGADDNASGTVGVVMIAKAVAATGVKPEKTIIFCAWTGEEKGLLGSDYFTRYPTMGKISDVKFYLNYDMISRDVATDTEKNMAGMTFTNTYPKLEEWSKANIEKYNIGLNVSFRGNPAPTGGSDYSAFTRNQVPVIAWMAAMHPEYHQITDHVSLVNWEKMQNIIKLGFLQVWDAANNDLK